MATTADSLTPTHLWATAWVGSPAWRKLGCERLRECLAARDLHGAFVMAGMLRVGGSVLEVARRLPDGRPIYKTVSSRSISRLLRSIKVVAAKIHVGSFRRFAPRPRGRRARSRASRRGPPSREPDEPRPPLTRKAAA